MKLSARDTQSSQLSLYWYAKKKKEPDFVYVCPCEMLSQPVRMDCIRH